MVLPAKAYKSENHDVVEGSVWEAGPHKFICGDAIELMREGILQQHIPQVDAIYTDPPWNTGNRSMFYNYAGKKPTDTFDEFLFNLVQLYKTFCPVGRVGIEMGVKAFPTMLEILKAEGAVTHAEGTTTYGSPARPLSVWFGSFGNAINWGNFQVPPNLHGPHAIEFGMKAVIPPDGTFYDPCCGNLVFTLAAMKIAGACYGTEIIPNKLAQGLDKLKGKYEVKRIA